MDEVVELASQLGLGHLPKSLFPPVEVVEFRPIELNGCLEKLSGLIHRRVRFDHNHLNCVLALQLLNSVTIEVQAQPSAAHPRLLLLNGVSVASERYVRIKGVKLFNLRQSAFRKRQVRDNEQVEDVISIHKQDL